MWYDTRTYANITRKCALFYRTSVIRAKTRMVRLKNTRAGVYSTCAILKMLQNTVLISKRTDAALFHQVQSFSRTFILVVKTGDRNDRFSKDTSEQDMYAVRTLNQSYRTNFIAVKDVIV